MATWNRYVNGIMVASYNEDTRIYTEYNSSGAVVLTRPFTPEENEAADARIALENQLTVYLDLQSKGLQALTINKEWLNRAGTPTNAQVLAQVDRLTRQSNGVIRLLLSKLDSTEGT